MKTFYEQLEKATAEMKADLFAKARARIEEENKLKGNPVSTKYLWEPATEIKQDENGVVRFETVKGKEE